MLFRPLQYVLYLYISTFRSLCSVHNMAVVCSSLISCFRSVLLSYCLSDFEMVPVATVITGFTLVFTFYMCWISFTRSLYFKIFSASLLITFLSPGIATSNNTRVPSFIITDYDIRFIVRIIIIIIIIICNIANQDYCCTFSDLHCGSFSFFWQKILRVLENAILRNIWT